MVDVEEVCQINNEEADCEEEGAETDFWVRFKLVVMSYVI